MANINDVILQGVITHKFVAPKVAILTINTGKATPAVNYPKVTFFNELRDVIDANFKEGDHVTITGNIQSSKPKPDIKNQSLIAIFGESIESTKSLIEQAFSVKDEDSYKPFKNEIKIAGVVTHIESPASGLVKFTVATRKNGRQSYVTLVHYTTSPEKVMAELHPRDSVMVVGCVQTSKKEIKGVTKYFENYVATEIKKVNE